MKNFKLLSLCLLFVVAISCKDKDKVEPNKTALLTGAKGWVVTKIELNGKDVTSGVLEDCDKDDVLTFKTDGTFVDGVGTNKCETDEKDDTGKWTFKTNETILSLTYTGETSSIDSKLVSISSTTLKTSDKEPFTGLEMITTYTAK